MAVLYYRTRADIDDPNVEIRAINDDGYAVAVGFQADDQCDDAVIEVLLTKDEARDIYDAAFNQ